MNEHLIERFGRGKASRDSHVPSGLTARPPATLNLSIREYAKAAEQPADSSHWTAFREIPSSNEVFDRGRTEHDTALELAENTIVGPYTSKEEYLETHYRLLREDAVAVCITSNQCSLERNADSELFIAVAGCGLRDSSIPSPDGERFR